MGNPWGHGQIGGGIDEEPDINLLPEQAVTPSISNGKRMGVYGRSPKNTGVHGVSTTSIGVYGESQEDIGVFGKGGRLAGSFEGNVEITQNLTVNGLIFMGGDTVHPLASWISRIRQLEAEVADLRSRLPSSGQSSGPATATIGVDLTLRPGPFNDLRVFGSGFAPNEPIEINVTSTGGSSGQSATTADASGKFSHTVSVSCTSGQQTTHTAFARGVSSGRISNKAGASC
jgi:hypothetical protein